MAEGILTRNTSAARRLHGDGDDGNGGDDNDDDGDDNGPAARFRVQGAELLNALTRIWGKLGAFGSMASRPSYFNEPNYPSYSNVCHPLQSLGTRKQAYTEFGLSV